MFSGHVPERGCDGIGPGEEFIEAALGVAVDDAGDDVGEVGVRIDADKLAGFDQRSDHGPVLGTAVGTGEESVLAIEGQGPDRALDGVVVDLDPAVVEEQAQTVPP